MNITIFGTGYVGLVSGVCFAEMGNTVTCVDVDEKKVTQLQQAICPIFEPGLDSLLASNLNGFDKFSPLLFLRASRKEPESPSHYPFLFPRPGS